MTKEILIVFKTHLDIGYTELAKDVMDRYLHSFIPNAIRIGYELKDTDTPFIWTVGAWLIHEALKQDHDGALEQAIRDGVIAWHGLPFTYHTELMDPALFSYGLTLAQTLNERFGKTTAGAKMTDVPGHTIGMVPLLADAGISFLHIGVNTATPVPNVPPVFRWRCGDREIVVACEGSYGGNLEFDDFVLVFAHTNDNMGPQSPEEIRAIYRDLANRYPGYTVRAATLDDVAKRMVQLPDLPVITQEIGDTWIHGAGTDPKKIGMFRELMRFTAQNGTQGKDLADSLLVVPEHTWGACIQLHFPNRKDWFHNDLANTADAAKKAFVEASWNEQRDYVRKAEEVLGVRADYTLSAPDLTGFVPCDGSDLPVQLSWQLFDADDYTRYINKYLVLTQYTIQWAAWDFTKPELPHYKGGIYAPTVRGCWEKDGKKIYHLAFDDDFAETYGLPCFYVTVCGNEIEVDWLGKRANRLPQAFWLQFKDSKTPWEISKLGQWIDPDHVLGSPLIMATDYGVRNADTAIESLDACLVAPFGRRLLDFELSPTGKDLYFNLYNNIWNTNFPIWYADDTRFRFVIKDRD